MLSIGWLVVSLNTMASPTVAQETKPVNRVLFPRLVECVLASMPVFINLVLNKGSLSKSVGYSEEKTDFDNSPHSIFKGVTLSSQVASYGELQGKGFLCAA